MSTASQAARGLVAAWVLGALVGCPRALEGGGDEQTLYLLLGDQHVATVRERVTPTRIERRSTLVGRPAERSHVVYNLDSRGLLLSARYERVGDRGERTVALTAEGGLHLQTDDQPTRWPLPAPLAALETLRHVAPEALPLDVHLLDLSSAETTPARLTLERGAVVARDLRGLPIARALRSAPTLLGPGTFQESVSRTGGRAIETHPPMPAPPGPRYRLDPGDAFTAALLSRAAPGQEVRGSVIVKDPALAAADPPTAAHRRAAPFMDSDAPQVRAFAAQHASGPTPTSEALAIAEAIHAMLDTSGGGGPPSARSTLSRRAGDCDDATALLVAAVRARGHAARAVAGYRHVSGRWSPHAWAEVWDGERWAPVDALVPGVGPFATHLAMFEGLGSPLTMGRVLGRFRPRIDNGVVVDDTKKGEK